MGERYRIDRFLDEGGAGEVYSAQNVWTSRQVAIKRLLPELLSEATLVERFLLEGRIGGKIEHPNIVQVLDMGREASDESLFIVQELLRGESLRALIDKRGRLPVGDALDLAVPILGALVAVHQQGIVHRDIKPENIFVLEAPFGQRIPKLLDFGIAKVRLENTLTRAGSVMGTLGYMPPEQLEGAKEVDRRADIWSIGIVLYELLAGAHPFQADSYLDALDKIMRRDARALHDIVPGCPKGVSDVVQKTLRKNRQERPDSMLSILEDLLRWSRTETDELLRSLVSRHRLSIPSSLEQKLLVNEGPVAPASLRATWSTGRRLPVPTLVPPLRASEAPAPDSRAAPADDIEIEVDLESQAPPAVSEPDDTLIDLRDAVLVARAQRDQARSAIDAMALPLSPQGAASSMSDEPEPESDSGVLQLQSYANLAREALARNDFSTACHVADRVASAAAGDPESQAAMRVLQARACFWLGDSVEHEVQAFSAFHLAAPGSSLRFQAAAELACASTALGAHDTLLELVDELVQASVDNDVLPAYLVACCRLGIALQQADWPEHVERVLGRVQQELHTHAETKPEVRAWMFLLRAELAGHNGDPAHSLALTRDAVLSFAAQGDGCWASMCKASAAWSTLLLGGYADARAELSVAIDEATAANIHQADIMRLNLGLAEIRGGDLDGGIQELRSSVASLENSPDWRVRAAGHLYLAEALTLQGNAADAEREARTAIELAQPSPSARAQALAMLALVLMPRPMEAFIAASQAMDILTSLGGVAEDEARIRLVYAMALDALGHERNAREAFASARRRLLERAERISDPHWRKSFLERVRDHERTLALAADRADADPQPAAQD